MFLNEIKKTIQTYEMLKPDDTVIVALSGGADSVCLLNAMLDLKEELKINVAACHVNHCLRGEESDSDEAFVRKICEENKIYLYYKRADVEKIAKEQKIGLELCGRNVRYEFFEELSDENNAKIATAHSSSDNAETLIFNIIRGTGLKGASAIPPIRNNGKFIRPLLFVTREQIENYCKEKDLSFVTDSSNLTNDYTRNNIRNRIIPMLKEINPGLENSLCRFTNQMAKTSDFLNCFTIQELKKAEVKTENYKNTYYDCNKLEQLHEAILCNAVNLIYKEKTGYSLEEKHVLLCLNIIKDKSGAVNLPGYYDARIYKNKYFYVFKV